MPNSGNCLWLNTPRHPWALISLFGIWPRLHHYVLWGLWHNWFAARAVRLIQCSVPSLANCSLRASNSLIDYFVIFGSPSSSSKLSSSVFMVRPFWGSVLVATWFFFLVWLAGCFNGLAGGHVQLRLRLFPSLCHPPCPTGFVRSDPARSGIHLRSLADSAIRSSLGLFVRGCRLFARSGPYFRSCEMVPTRATSAPAVLPWLPADRVPSTVRVPS
ncbi:hypothetical protein R1flu_012205 [Riccia fluitans]|uniref:Uncharacterized protein n=1 Tax=Riccia fluitans TaxID=41844 RepID=A0ABD1ZA67_9MARC